MTLQERVMEAAKLRLRFQMNSRLRLESLAALSRVFREFDEPLREELLGAMVFAVPEELLGPADPEAHFSVEDGRLQRITATPKDVPATPRNPTPKNPTPKNPTPKNLTASNPTPKNPTPKNPTPKNPTPKNPTPKGATARQSPPTSAARRNPKGARRRRRRK